MFNNQEKPQPQGVYQASTQSLTRCSIYSPTKSDRYWDVPMRQKVAKINALNDLKYTHSPEKQPHLFRSPSPKKEKNNTTDSSGYSSNLEKYFSRLESTIDTQLKTNQSDNSPSHSKDRQYMTASTTSSNYKSNHMQTFFESSQHQYKKIRMEQSQNSDSNKEDTQISFALSNEEFPLDYQKITKRNKPQALSPHKNQQYTALNQQYNSLNNKTSQNNSQIDHYLDQFYQSQKAQSHQSDQQLNYRTPEVFESKNKQAYKTQGLHNQPSKIHLKTPNKNYQETQDLEQNTPFKLNAEKWKKKSFATPSSTQGQGEQNNEQNLPQRKQNNDNTNNDFTINQEEGIIEVKMKRAAYQIKPELAQQTNNYSSQAQNQSIGTTHLQKVLLNPLPSSSSSADLSFKSQEEDVKEESSIEFGDNDYQLSSKNSEVSRLQSEMVESSIKITDYTKEDLEGTQISLPKQQLRQSIFQKKSHLSENSSTTKSISQQFQEYQRLKREVSQEAIEQNQQSNKKEGQKKDEDQKVESSKSLNLEKNRFSYFGANPRYSSLSSQSRSPQSINNSSETTFQRTKLYSQEDKLDPNNFKNFLSSRQKDKSTSPPIRSFYTPEVSPFLESQTSSKSLNKSSTTATLNKSTIRSPRSGKPPKSSHRKTPPRAMYESVAPLNKSQYRDYSKSPSKEEDDNNNSRSLSGNKRESQDASQILQNRFNSKDIIQNLSHNNSYQAENQLKQQKANEAQNDKQQQEDLIQQNEGQQAIENEEKKNQDRLDKEQQQPPLNLEYVKIPESMDLRDRSDSDQNSKENKMGKSIKNLLMKPFSRLINQKQSKQGYRGSQMQQPDEQFVIKTTGMGHREIIRTSKLLTPDFVSQQAENSEGKDKKSPQDDLKQQDLNMLKQFRGETVKSKMSNQTEEQKELPKGHNVQQNDDIKSNNPLDKIPINLTTSMPYIPNNKNSNSANPNNTSAISDHPINLSKAQGSHKQKEQKASKSPASNPISMASSRIITEEDEESEGGTNQNRQSVTVIEMDKYANRLANIIESNKSASFAPSSSQRGVSDDRTTSIQTSKFPTHQKNNRSDLIQNDQLYSQVKNSNHQNPTGLDMMKDEVLLTSTIPTKFPNFALTESTTTVKKSSTQPPTLRRADKSMSGLSIKQHNSNSPSPIHHQSLTTIKEDEIVGAEFNGNENSQNQTNFNHDETLNSLALKLTPRQKQIPSQIHENSSPDFTVHNHTLDSGKSVLTQGLQSNLKQSKRFNRGIHKPKTPTDSSHNTSKHFTRISAAGGGGIGGGPLNKIHTLTSVNDSIASSERGSVDSELGELDRFLIGNNNTTHNTIGVGGTHYGVGGGGGYSTRKSTFSSPERQRLGSLHNIKKDKFYSFVNAIIRLRRAMRQTFYLNRLIYDTYDLGNEPPRKRIYSIHDKLVKQRNQDTEVDLNFLKREEKQKHVTAKLDYWEISDSKKDTKQNLNIPPNSADPDLERITYADSITKYRGESKKTHSRWLVLRGFTLYWYREEKNKKAKGIIPLPEKPITEIEIQNVSSSKIKTAMVLDVEGREMVFVQDAQGIVWKMRLMNQIAYKNYLTYVWRLGISPDPELIKYFDYQHCKTLSMKNLEIIDQVIVELLFDSLYFHNRLKELNLSGAGLGNIGVGKLVEVLVQSKLKLTVLNLEQNSLTCDVTQYLGDFLASESSTSIKVISLKDNPIGNSGFQELADKFQARVSLMNKSGHIALPFHEMNFEGCNLSDQSLFSMIGVFEKINSKITEEGFEKIPKLMTLNLANNAFSDNSMKAFSRILGNFQGIKELDLSYNNRLTQISFVNLIKALETNYSLEELKYKGNMISHLGFRTFMDSMVGNPSLKVIKFCFDRELLGMLMVKEETIMRYFSIKQEDDRD